MINCKDKELSITMQCEILSINRSTLYYKPMTFMDRINPDVISQIVEIYEHFPFYGVRRTYHELLRRGYHIGRDRISKVKKELSLRTFYPAPKTTFRNKKHKTHPYLLKELEITASNQVWATDITYIPLKVGFAYLVSIIDLYSRKILTWSLSNSLDKSFCIDILNEAIERYGIPEILNSDQGSQFTSDEFTQILINKGIKISMDSKGRALDNVYIERFWRTLKQEDIYLNRYETMPEARIGINKFLYFYNTQRLHSSLEYKTPDEIYYNILPEVQNIDKELVLT
jgi:putative transposase